MSVLLSTDMFTLIDEDAIVPFDPLIKTPETRRGSKLLSGIHGEQPDRRQDLGIRSSAVGRALYNRIVQELTRPNKPIDVRCGEA
jgi:hypothetical protein